MATARHALRQRREQQGLTQEGAAFALRVAVSTYRSWERGEKTPRVGYRPRLAKLLDVSLTQVDTYLSSNGDTAAPNGHAVPAWLGHLASIEQGASQICCFEPVVVHGLLQTAEYAAAVERFDPVPRTEEGVARRVDLRVARQRVLTREPDPLDLSVVLDESVLYRVAGGREVMGAQLDHLTEMAERPNVDLRVLPLDAGVFSAAFGAFKLLSSPGASDPYMACVEDRAGPHYLDRQPEVEAHVLLFNYLSDVALPPAESVDAIRSIAKEKYQ